MNNLKETSLKCKKQLQDPRWKRFVDYLNNRLITDELIDLYDIGLGQFNNKLWLTIPVKDVNGDVLFMKLRRDPEDKSDEVKYKFHPNGSTATIYGWELLKDGGEKICAVEGEFDSILMNSMGITTITSTAGSLTFKSPWIEVFEDFNEIYLCFDRDPAGSSGAQKLGKNILKRFPFKKVSQIILPEMENGGKDITDYFMTTDGNLDRLFSEECCHRVVPEFNFQEEVIKRKNSFDGKLEITEEDIAIARNANCSDFVKVEKTSGEIKFAKCPFKEEKTASFACYPGEKGYYCFSCGKGSDAISLIQELYNLDFVQAVKFILQNKKS
jgi:DNA primase